MISTKEWKLGVLGFWGFGVLGFCPYMGFSSCCQRCFAALWLTGWRAFFRSPLGCRRTKQTTKTGQRQQQEQQGEEEEDCFGLVDLTRSFSCLVREQHTQIGFHSRQSDNQQRKKLLGWIRSAAAFARDYSTFSIIGCCCCLQLIQSLCIFDLLVTWMHTDVDNLFFFFFFFFPSSHRRERI